MIEKKWRVFFFPHFHYDVVWKFNRRDYSYVNARILRQVVTLCSMFPEFRFGVEDAYQLVEVEKEEPQLFQSIVEEAKKGWILVVDGQYLMADSFLPGGEVFVREILRGKRYVREKLGQEVEVGWITDSFGLNAQIPQIYRDAGYRWLAFGRGAERKLGRSEFWWKGLDGTEILAHYFSSKHSYHVGLFAEYLEQNVEELKRYAATKNVLMPCGIGSCPFPEWILKALEDFVEKHPDHEIRIASPKEFFEAVEQEGGGLETVEGEMYSGDRVFDSVWSTRMWVKLRYFRVRNLVLNAEKFATIAWLLGKPYPRQVLDEAWDRMLFFAFHDVITGTSIDEVFDEVREHFDWLEEVLTHILEDSLEHILANADVEEESIVVFNPNAFPVKAYVEHELEFGEGVKRVFLEDVDYEVVEEVRDGEGWLKRARIGFVAEVPALGYRVYRVGKSQLMGRVSRRRRVHRRDFVESPYLKVFFNPLTGVCRILGRDGDEVVREFRLEVENEVGSVYTHRDISMGLVGVVAAEGDTSPNKPVFVVEDVWVEEGSLSQRVVFMESLYGCFWPYRLREHYGMEFYRQKLMDVWKEVVVYRDLPWAEFRVRVLSRFPHIRLRARFDMGFEGEYFANTAFGVVKREKEPREFPMEDWVWYGGADKGVVLATQGIPGHEVRDSTIYLTLLRSVDLLSHGDKGPIVPVPDALELNRPYEYRFALFLCRGDWRSARAWEKAAAIANPLISTHYLGKAEEKIKPLPSGEYSFLSLPQNVVLSCLKQSEDGDSVILRCYETAGTKTPLALSIFKKPKEVLVSNITEEREERAEAIELKPFQILTLKLRF